MRGARCACDGAFACRRALTEARDRKIEVRDRRIEAGDRRPDQRQAQPLPGLRRPRILWFRIEGRATLAAMGDAAAIQDMSAADYLVWERSQHAKHEFHLGEVFAMAGGSPRHNFFSGAMIAELPDASC